jgi:cell division protease FtsH
MVTEYGMSAKLGAVKYGKTDGEPFLGRTVGHERDYSEKIAAEIDNEVRALIELAHDEAWEILVEYRDVLDDLVNELMERETVSQTDMARICARVEKRPPMAPYSVNGRRSRPAIGSNGSEAAALPPPPPHDEAPTSVTVGKAAGSHGADADH